MVLVRPLPVLILVLAFVISRSRRRRSLNTMTSYHRNNWSHSRATLPGQTRCASRGGCLKLPT